MLPIEVYFGRQSLLFWTERWSVSSNSFNKSAQRYKWYYLVSIGSWLILKFSHALFEQVNVTDVYEKTEEKHSSFED